MPIQMLRRNWTPRIVLVNAIFAGFVGLAAVRVAEGLGLDTDTASAIAGTVGYMAAMTVEFVYMCIREHYATPLKQRSQPPADVGFSSSRFPKP